MMVCSGNGICLEPNSQIKCQHQCQRDKCPNYVICGAMEPKWIFDCNEAKCIECAANGFILTNLGISKCPICLESKDCIKQQNCQHPICVSCWKRCHPVYEDEPPFPYSVDIEDAYFERDDDNHNWSEDELIIQYKKDYDEWDQNNEKRYRNEAHLRLCPLCPHVK